MKNMYVCALLLLTSALSAEHYQNSNQSSVQKNLGPQDASKTSIKVAHNPKLGNILTDSRGMTLYVFMADKDENSTCYDHCAIAWQPFVASSEKPTLPPGIAGKLDTAKRRDNTTQVTYNGMPLYFYVKDKKPGDVYGHYVESKWFVVRPK